jgi:hypothetical protein
MQPTYYEEMAQVLLKSVAYSVSVPYVHDIRACVETLNRLLDLLSAHMVPAGNYRDGLDCGEAYVIRDKEKYLAALEAEPDTEVLTILFHKLVNTLSDILVTLMKYRAAGCKTFNISKNLTTLLHDTDISGTYEFLKVPYSTFYFSIPDSPIYVFSDDIESQVYGLFVSKHSNGKLVFLAVGDLCWSRSYVQIDKVGPADTVDMADFDHGDQVKYSPGVELAVKALLYLNSSNPDVKPGDNEYARVEKKLKKAKEPKKKDRLSKYLSTLSTTEYFDVGRSIKVSKQKYAPERCEYEGGFHYSYRFWVRGHFRNQVCGKGRADRKLMWIEPYMKGPDQAAIVHRQYDIV